MEQLSTTWFVVLITVLVIWDLAWRLVALWRSAQKKQIAWFVCIGIFNTVGILPIIYLLLNRERK
jgi:hypothetical protein